VRGGEIKLKDTKFNNKRISNWKSDLCGAIQICYLLPSRSKSNALGPDRYCW